MLDIFNIQFNIKLWFLMGKNEDLSIYPSIYVLFKYHLKYFSSIYYLKTLVSNTYYFKTGFLSEENKDLITSSVSKWFNF